MKNFTEFKKVIDQMEKTRGYELDSEAVKLENGFKIMVINYGYLDRITASIPTYSVDQKDEKDKHMVEATRCFVNFLTSAVAFKDHFRVMMQRLYGQNGEALGGKYSEKVKEEFVNDNTVGFIEALRNLYCHYEVPSVGFRSTIENEDFVTRFVFFLKGNDFTSNLLEKGNPYVCSLEDDFVDVQSVCKDYVYKSAFPWLMTTQADFHKDDFKEYEKLRDKARELFMS